MKKTTIFLVILLLFLVTILTLYFSFKSNLTGKTIIDYHTHTKAICNETNYCQDYIISCNGEKIITMNPITGASIQHLEDWKDPRNESEKELCK